MDFIRSLSVADYIQIGLGAVVLVVIFWGTWRLLMRLSTPPQARRLDGTIDAESVTATDRVRHTAGTPTRILDAGRRRGHRFRESLHGDGRN